jgi:hypothetical protein
MGPLRVHPGNRRYFADAEGRARLLAGSHTWSNLADIWTVGEPRTPFDFGRYLDVLERHGHNFIRLWAWETAIWNDGRSAAAPFPWLRAGPGRALDGEPTFDLAQFDPEYFGRLRERVAAARTRGIYVSVMLFEGWALQHSRGAWDGHPFNPANNVSGIRGDGVDIYTLRAADVTERQEAYVAKVVDTVGDLDNVLYEISNENHGGSTAWQHHMIRLVRALEAGQPLQHPVGMTFQFKGGSNRELFLSPADWISPNPDGGYMDDPPAADGAKVILSDTDHLWGVGGSVAWVWKTVTRGGNPLFMDPMEELGAPAPAGRSQWEPIRRNLGYAVEYTARMDLARAVPTSGYCLAVPGEQYLVFLPGGRPVRLDLAGGGGCFASEWLDPAAGARTGGARLDAGRSHVFEPPWRGDAVLFAWKDPGGS